MKKIIIAFFGYVATDLLGVGGASKEYLELNGGVISSGITGGIYKTLSALALGLTVVYFMYELNSKWAFEGHDMNMKSLFAPFGKLIAAVVIIDQSEELWGTTFVDYYNGMIDWAANQTATGTLDPVNLTDETMNAVLGVFGVLELLLIMIICLIIMVVNWVIKLLWNYKAVVFKFELLFRIGASPLAMADVYNGAHSNAWRWIKGFIGTTLYGCALILIPKVGADIFGSMINNYINNLNAFSADPSWDKFKVFLEFLNIIFTMFVIPAAEIGCVGAVKQVLKEAAS